MSLFRRWPKAAFPRDLVLVFVLRLILRVCRTSETVRIFLVVHQPESFLRPFCFGQLDNCRPGFDDGKIGQENEREGGEDVLSSFPNCSWGGPLSFLYSQQ